MSLRAVRVGVAIVAMVTALTSVPAGPGAAPAAAQDQEQVVVELPAAIDATGEGDVTQRLTGFFAGRPPGTTVRFPPDGRYRIEGTVRIEGKDRLTVEGNESMLFATTQGGLRRIHVEVIGGSAVRFRGLAVKGAHPNGGLDDDAYQPDLEGQHGFAFRGTNGVELDGVAVTDVYGDFVYLGRTDDGGPWTRRVWIHDSIFARNGRQGIAIVAGQDVVIERNLIGDVARSTIDLEPNAATGGAINIHVLDNDVGRGRLLFLAAAGNGPVSSVVVADNRLTGRALTATILPPPGERRDRFWIVGNRGGNASSRTPIKVNRVDGLVVWRNRQPLRRGEVGVELNEVCGIIVSENDFGPFAQPATPQTTTCGTQLGPVPPDPPEVLGRPVAQRPQPELPDAEPEEAPEPGPPAVIPTAGEQQNWAITITLGLLAAAMVVAALVLRRRRT
jgi:hypothetical protein